tara:strand:- start:253 stop:1029 length:777 start_codon:yes stop_codon:yes gene_type:complete
MKTAAERLKWARQRAGYASAADFARRHGLTEVTYRAHENGLRGLSERVARRYAAAMRGADWVWLLTGAGEPFAETEGDGPEPGTAAPDASHAPDTADTPAAPTASVREDGAAPRIVPLPPMSQLPRDVEVLGVAAGGDDGIFAFNGSVVDYVRRPPGIAAADQIFGLYVVGDSMAPRYEDGDLVYVHKGRRPAVGNDVVVELHGADGQPGQCFIKRLARRTGSRVLLRQFNPEREIEFAAREVRQIYKILTTAELLGI